MRGIEDKLFAYAGLHLIWINPNPACNQVSVHGRSKNATLPDNRRKMRRAAMRYMGNSRLVKHFNLIYFLTGEQAGINSAK